MTLPRPRQWGGAKNVRAAAQFSLSTGDAQWTVRGGRGVRATGNRSVRARGRVHKPQPRALLVSCKQHAVRRRPSGSIDRSHARPSAGIIGDGVPPGLARSVDPCHRGGPGRAPCRSRCPAPRRQAPGRRLVAPQPAPQRRPPATLTRLGKESTVWAAFPGRVLGGPLPAVRHSRQNQSSSSSGPRFSATQLYGMPAVCTRTSTA